MLVSIVAGCTAGRSAPGIQVDQAWEAARGRETVSKSPPSDPAPNSKGLPADDVIALVDGRPIARRRVVDLLLRGHGPGILEQLIVLEAAKREAAERGLVVSEADVEAEYERALKQLVSALPSAEPEVFDRKAGEAMLGEILSRRNISQEEYGLAIRRNAYLRKIVNADLHFTDEQLREEFTRTYGQRIEVRHIQVANLREAQKVRRDLDAGADFVDLVRRYSANPNTGLTQGLLRSFSRDDPDVPPLLREVAFALEDGQVSSPLRVGNWYHIIRRERTYPASRVDYRDVRDDLERRLRDRAVEPAVRQLYRTLYDRSDITIRDPVLRAAFDEKRSRAGRRERIDDWGLTIGD